MPNGWARNALRRNEASMKITKTVQGLALGTSLAAFVTLGVPADAKAENLLDQQQMEQVGKKKEEKKDDAKKKDKKGDKKEEEAKCGEGKCGEGKCGEEDKGGDDDK
jgi:uncharacterized low-complexity protein